MVTSRYRTGVRHSEKLPENGAFFRNNALKSHGTRQRYRDFLPFLT